MQCTYNVYIVARSRNYCCRGNAILCTFCIIVDFHVAVNNIKPLSVAMETQEWILFALLSGYKTFLTDVSTIEVIWSSRKVLGIFVRFEPHLGFLDRLS